MTVFRITGTPSYKKTIVAPASASTRKGDGSHDPARCFSLHLDLHSACRHYFNINCFPCSSTTCCSIFRPVSSPTKYLLMPIARHSST